MAINHMTLALDVVRVGSFYQTHHQGIKKMKHILFLIFVGAFLSGCQASTIQMFKEENTKIYSKIDDPVYGKVHSFQFGSECGDLKRNPSGASKFVGKWHSSDCGQNSVRSEISELGHHQPKESWYRWNVFLPNDFPIQEGGKLLLGQWHNGECPHVSFTSPGKAGSYNGFSSGVLYFETMKTWQGDCKDTQRIPFTSIQELRGKWTEFVMFARWSNKADGKFQIYINGELAMNWDGRTLTKGKESRNYVKVGIYQCCNGDNPIKPASAMFTTPERSKDSFLPK